MDMKSSEEMIRSMEDFMCSIGTRVPIYPMCGTWTSVFEHMEKLRVIPERIEMTREFYDRITSGLPIHRGSSASFGPGIEITIRKTSSYLSDDWIRVWGYAIKHESDVTT
jgi:hypothetical protein